MFAPHGLHPRYLCQLKTHGGSCSKIQPSRRIDGRFFCFGRKGYYPWQRRLQAKGYGARGGQQLVSLVRYGVYVCTIPYKTCSEVLTILKFSKGGLACEKILDLFGGHFGSCSVDRRSLFVGRSIQSQCRPILGLPFANTENTTLGCCSIPIS